MKEWLIVAGKKRTKKEGILALQGEVREHVASLTRLKNVRPLKVKYPEQIAQIDALIIPGGESTTIGKLIERNNFVQPIKKFCQQHKPIWGTCAGMILVAKKVNNRKHYPRQKNYNLNLMDITVQRNAYGSQLNSFITRHSIPAISDQPLKLVFIRAPIITATGPEVKILTRVKGNIAAAEQDNLFVTNFHPELTEDIRVHQYFVNKIETTKNSPLSQ
ncbi:MAG: pyridoxal 5'-phosphate synthase glutaminase subunit PdxT [Bacillota bacterium]